MTALGQVSGVPGVGHELQTSLPDGQDGVTALGQVSWGSVTDTTLHPACSGSEARPRDGSALSPKLPAFLGFLLPAVRRPHVPGFSLS